MSKPPCCRGPWTIKGQQRNVEGEERDALTKSEPQVLNRNYRSSTLISLTKVINRLVICRFAKILVPNLPIIGKRP